MAFRKPCPLQRGARRLSRRQADCLADSAGERFGGNALRLCTERAASIGEDTSIKLTFGGVHERMRFQDRLERRKCLGRGRRQDRSHDLDVGSIDNAREPLRGPA